MKLAIKQIKCQYCDGHFYLDIVDAEEYNVVDCPFCGEAITP